MKRIFYIALVLLGISTASNAQVFLNGAAEISDVIMEKRVDSDNLINLIFDIKFDGTQLKSNREFHFTPYIKGEKRMKRLPSAIITGRKRQIFRDRNKSYFADEEVLTITPNAKEKNQKIEYVVSFPYEQWMGGAQLFIEEEECGCTTEVLAQNTKEMNKFFVDPNNLVPYLVYVEPEIEENKVRSIVASAFIDFPINKSTIYPEYRNNPIELSKIRGAIDKVVYDPDIRIASIDLKGNSSPEGPYKYNESLAKTRTASLKSYLLSLQIPGLTDDGKD